MRVRVVECAIVLVLMGCASFLFLIGCGAVDNSSEAIQREAQCSEAIAIELAKLEAEEAVVEKAEFVEYGSVGAEEFEEVQEDNDSIHAAIT